MFEKVYKGLGMGGVEGRVKKGMRKGRGCYKNVDGKRGCFRGIKWVGGYLKGNKGEEIGFGIMNENVVWGREGGKLEDGVCEMFMG